MDEPRYVEIVILSCRWHAIYQAKLEGSIPPAEADARMLELSTLIREKNEQLNIIRKVIHRLTNDG